jgi:hypothetical protein
MTTFTALPFLQTTSTIGPNLFESLPRIIVLQDKLDTLAPTLITQTAGGEGNKGEAIRPKGLSKATIKSKKGTVVPGDGIVMGVSFAK